MSLSQLELPMTDRGRKLVCIQCGGTVISESIDTTDKRKRAWLECEGCGYVWHREREEDLREER